MTHQAQRLTPREDEVLQLLCSGTVGDQALAKALCVSNRTASYHVSNLMAKFGCSTRGALIGYAYRHGLVKHE